MAALDKLIPEGQPAVADGGVDGYATAGATWYWKFTDVDGTDGLPIDLSSGAGVTGVSKVIDPDGTPVATLVVTGASDGSYTLTLDKTTTAAIVVPTHVTARQCRWYVNFTDGTNLVEMWGPSNSFFNIYPGS